MNDTTQLHDLQQAAALGRAILSLRWVCQNGPVDVFVKSAIEDLRVLLHVAEIDEQGREEDEEEGLLSEVIGEMIARLAAIEKRGKLAKGDRSLLTDMVASLVQLF